VPDAQQPTLQEPQTTAAVPWPSWQLLAARSVRAGYSLVAWQVRPQSVSRLVPH